MRHPSTTRCRGTRCTAPPNVVTAIALIQDGSGDVPQPVGGATIEVRAARRTELRELDVSRRNGSGRVVLREDGSLATEGEVLIANRPDGATREIVYRAAPDADGRFDMDTTSPPLGAPRSSSTTSSPAPANSAPARSK